MAFYVKKKEFKEKAMARETIIIGSVTYAMKAKRKLGEVGVQSRLIKAAPQIDRGCTYGLEFDGNDRLTVVAIMRENGIAYEFRSPDQK